MEQIELVVKVPKDYYETLKMMFKNYEFSKYSNPARVAILKGIPLPKGHGRLIDADDVNNHIVGYVDLRGCKTIVEADKEGAEE